MPNLDEIIKSRDTKKFVKKNYRPWDLTGSEISPLIENDSSADTKQPDTTVHKLDIIDINKDIIKATNGEQLDSTKAFNRYHLDIAKDNNRIPNREQLDIDLDVTSTFNRIMKISGVQKSILNFIVDVCVIKKRFETGPIETATISLYAKTSIGVIKISIKRLIDKGFITRKPGKQARGGYINLGITEEIYNIVLECREMSLGFNESNNLAKTIRYQLDINNLHSSSNIINKTTTKKHDVIPEEWQKINFEPLVHIGFSITQIKQLIDKAEPSIVQESINHFAYGLEYNEKSKKYVEPLNVLMGVLRKGQGWFEVDYRSPQEIAQERLLEQKRRELERRKTMEENAYKLALDYWQASLQENEVLALVPKKAGDITPQAARISMYFREHVWPKVKSEYVLEG
jgi:hypothetical protein